MAEDNGAGLIGALSAIPFAVGGAVAAAAGAAKNLLVELGEMDNFKKRVDQLLVELNESPAAHNKVAEDRLQQSSLGGSGFREAEFLYASYNIVHNELESLSKVLGLQIESMKLAIHASQKGYAQIDDDIKERMRKLNAEIAAHYDKSRDPNADVNGYGGTGATGDTAPKTAPAAGADGQGSI